MAKAAVKDLHGAVSHYYKRYMIGANVVAGQILIRQSATNVGGEVTDPTTTAFSKAVGIASTAQTYSTTQADFLADDPILGIKDTLGRSVGVVIQPFAVHWFRVSGGATVGTAIGTASPANIVTNTSADTTGLTVTAAEVGTISMAGGTLIGRKGNNAGQYRRISTHTNNTSLAVTVPLPNTIAVNDTFYRVPWSGGTIVAQLTTDFTELNGIIATGTGGDLLVLEFVVDDQNDVVWAKAVLRDHLMNALA